MKNLLEIIVAVIIVALIVMTVELNVVFDHINDIEGWLNMPVDDEVE